LLLLSVSSRPASVTPDTSPAAQLQPQIRTGAWAFHDPEGSGTASST